MQLEPDVNLPISNLKSLKLANRTLIGENFQSVSCGISLFSNLIVINILLIVHILIGAGLQLCESSILQGLGHSLPKIGIVFLLFNITLISTIFRGFLNAGLATLITVFCILSVAIAFGSKGNVGSDIAEGALIGIVNYFIFAISLSILAVSMAAGYILGRKFFLVGLVIISVTTAVWMALLDTLLEIPISFFSRIGAVFVVLLTALTAGYIAQQAVSEKDLFSWIRSTSVAFVALWGTSFQGANLTEASFAHATLKCSDFRQSILNCTCWRGAKGLEFSRLGNTYLANPKIRQLVVTCNGRGQNFDGLDLTGVNLQGANLQDASFIGANLNQSNLRDADLSRAILKQTQLDDTDLTGAILTGACIEDWGMTSTTKLENVQCEYVFMRMPTKENPNPLRKPDNWQEIFTPGEFADFIQPYFDTLDLYHSQDVDPRAISLAFKKLSQNHPEANLEIVAMEKRAQSSFNLKVRTATTADKSELSSEYFAGYNQFKVLSEARLLLLAEKDDRIHSLEQMIQTALHQPTFNVETVQGDFMPENKGINISAGDNANISGVSSGDGIVNLGTISGSVTNAIKQLPDSSEAGQTSLKVLLTQLQKAIETDTDLSVSDKSDLLEQVQSLAEAKQTEEPTKREGIARKTMKMFDATLKSLPDTAKIVEACGKLLPLILKALGIPT